MILHRISLPLLLWGSLALPVQASPQQNPPAPSGAGSKAALPTAQAPTPRIEQPLPSFRLPDTAHNAHSLEEWRGQSVVVFFFCGCEPCHDCARAWAGVQQSGELDTLPTSANPNSPGKQSARTAAEKRAPKERTLIIYTGNAEEGARFLAETGLDRTRTKMLFDQENRVITAYDAEPCPRAFVADAAGRLRYTNPKPTLTPGDLPAGALTSRVLTALRQAPDPASVPQKRLSRRSRNRQ